MLIQFHECKETLLKKQQQQQQENNKKRNTERKTHSWLFENILLNVKRKTTARRVNNILSKI